MNAVSGLRGKFTDMRRRRLLGQLVKPALRSRVGPTTIGFASREPVEAVLADGTLVLYDGAVVQPVRDRVAELKPRAGYRIWERMVASE